MSSPAAISFCLALTLPIPALAATQAPDGQQQEATAEAAEARLLDSILPVSDGIVWYGTWEDAIAEMERTGKPVMLHMGSPRERNTCVPGTW